MAETAPKSTEVPSNDWDALNEAYNQNNSATSKETGPDATVIDMETRKPVETDSTNPETNNELLENMSRQLAAMREGLATLQAQYDSLLASTRGETSTPREHSPTESYVRDIMPGTVEIDDYQETHRAEMELIQQHRAEYQARKKNAETRKEQRKLARGELREANKLERKDRNSARYDKAKVIGKKALRGVGRFLKRAAVATGRGIKGTFAGNGSSASYEGKHRA